MKRYIYGGVRPDDGDYVFDYLYNLPDDIIEISPPQLFRSSIRNHIYWFGYMFKDSVSSKQRTDFINYIKGIRYPTMNSHSLLNYLLVNWIRKLVCMIWIVLFIPFQREAS